MGRQGTKIMFERWKQTKGRKRFALPITAGVLLLGGLVYGGYLWYYSRTHVSTDDAYVAAHMAPVLAAKIIDNIPRAQVKSSSSC